MCCDEDSLPTGEVVKFRLYYDGRLPSTRGRPESGQTDSRAKPKHVIRKVFHKQLRKFLEVHPNLQKWKSPTPFMPGIDLPPMVDAIADLHQSNNFRWVPLISENSGLAVNLEILYLRNGAPYVLKGADLDNRIKTLVDALKMPNDGEIDANEVPADDEDPFFVLLQDDRLVTRLGAESDILLLPTDESIADLDSRVFITVEIWRPGKGFF